MITCRVLAGCTVADNSKDGNLPNITLRFRTDLLKDDAVMVMDPLMNALAMTDPNSGWSAGGRPSDLLASLGPPKLCCHAVLFDPFCSVNLLSPGEPTAAMLLCCSSTFLASAASSAGRTLTLSAAADSLTLRVCRAVLAATDRDQRQLYARRSVASGLADRAVPVRAL